MKNIVKGVLKAQIVLLIVVAMFLIACTKKENVQSSPASSPSKASYTDNPWTDGEDLSGRTVEIFGAFVDVDAERFNASKAKFEEATGISVEYEGSGDFETLITVRVEGGDPPNIAAFPQPGLVADLVSRDYIADISSWFGSGYLEKQYNKTWLDLSNIGGITAGVFYRAPLKSLVWYSVPVFEKEGYEIPQTWDELIALSDRMVADGYKPWSIGIESSGATGWVATDWIEDILLRTTSPQKYDAWVKGELKFNSPEIRRAIKIMSDIWLNEDYVLGGKNAILTVPFGDAPTPLLANPPKALMHRQASFITAFFPKKGAEIPELINYFYLPPIDEQYGKPVLGSGDMFGAFDDEPVCA